jgi:diacylglycerol kinase family enzyme
MRVARRPAALGAAAGVAVGAAVELPAAGAIGLGVVALAWRKQRSLGTLATGAVVAAATTRVWPVAPRTPAEIRPALTPLDKAPSSDGDGLTVIVNVDSGGPWSTNPADVLREALPAARIVEVDADGLPDALRAASESGLAIGIAGGDGSICAAAAVAHVVDKPLLIVPAGTLNHLARDLGLDGAEAAIEAFRQGHAVAVDVATIDGKTFLNTASFGAYGSLVDAREKLESRFGKWPALMVALARVLRTEAPLVIELDGKRRSLWMIFVGNCRYHPAGFAPTWRERMDDGRLDVRLVDATSPYARTRLLLAVLTGRLGRSRVYEAFTTKELSVRVLEGSARLARDGETFDGSPEFVICKEERPLAVYVPRPDDSSLRSQRPNTSSSASSAATPTAVSQGPASL